ncbi:MAG TPA: phosphoribosylaminoimidazolesuccinocarboxamide synthase [Chloroflexia bacterium]|nr:phosphoribosylaminoimidazolesuccinocarboxamide synthase [Chloroflexia bacterium]
MEPSPILQTDLPLPLFGRGKVRDTYDLGEELLIVATDRISAFDSVLPTGIQYKGQVLTALSAFWFRRTADIVPNHMIAWERRDFPFEWQSWPQEQQEQLLGRAMLVKKAERIDIECVARGYLAGSAWSEYDQTGAITGITLPHGLVPSQQLPEPIFTPATKAASGHDENVTFERVEELVGQDLAEQLREATLKIYTALAEHARQRGVVVADTKLEFGLLDGQLILIDELGTPDSSRFWEVTKYRFGEDQASLDKQYVRDWLLQSGWDREPPAPALPDEVAQKTSEKYLEAYRQIVGHDLLNDLKHQ